MYKGAKIGDLDETSLSEAFIWAFGLGAICAFTMLFTVLPYMRKKIDEKFHEDGTLKPVRIRPVAPSSIMRYISLLR